MKFTIVVESEVLEIAVEFRETKISQVTLSLTTLSPGSALFLLTRRDG